MDKRNVIQVMTTNAAPPRRQFPGCAADVLDQVSKFCTQHSQKWRSSAAPRNNDLQCQLDSELFFSSTGDRRGCRLNPIQQLRLLQMLCDYFNEKEVDPRANQYLHFETIFCGREGEALHDARIELLVRLCSLAVQYPCYSLLAHVSQWLHKIGSGKSYAQNIVSHLVDDYILSPPEWDLHKQLLPLAEHVPEFAAYFVTFSPSKETIQSGLVPVLSGWLKGRRGSRIFGFIKDTPTAAKYFAASSFACLVAYDCVVGGAQENPLHGVICAQYAEWSNATGASSLPLNVLPVFEILSDEAAFPKYSTATLDYHVHLAQRGSCLTAAQLSAVLAHPGLSDRMKDYVSSKVNSSQC